MSTTMFVRNNQPGPTVLDEEGFETFQWDGLGSPVGADVLPLPSDLVGSYNFQRAQMLGILEVIEAPKSVEAQIERAKAAWARQKERQSITLASLGQLPAEDGAVPQEFKAQVGPGALPKTMNVEVGVITEDGQAVPKFKKAKVVMGPRGSYF